MTGVQTCALPICVHPDSVARPPLVNSHFFGVINLTSLEGGSIETGSVYTRCVKLNMAVAVFSGFGLVHEASLEKPKVSLLSIDNNL